MSKIGIDDKMKIFSSGEKVVLLNGNSYLIDSIRNQNAEGNIRYSIFPYAIFPVGYEIRNSDIDLDATLTGLGKTGVRINSNQADEINFGSIETFALDEKDSNYTILYKVKSKELDMDENECIRTFRLVR